jgi:signal peptidase
VRVCNILFTSILSLVVAVAAGLLVAQALGFKPMAVLSGSMEPAYATGSVVFVDTNASAESVAVGDVITYTLSGGTTVVTHRVIAIDKGQGLFTTKGDANDTEDGPVPFSSFVGRTVGFYIPAVGTLLLTMNTTQGIAIALFFLAFIVILFMVPIILAPSKVPASSGETEGRAATLVQRGGTGDKRRDKAGSRAKNAAAAGVIARGAHFRVKEQEQS